MAISNPNDWCRHLVWVNWKRIGQGDRLGRLQRLAEERGYACRVFIAKASLHGDAFMKTFLLLGGIA
ncbi:hypothetical protein V6243_17980, partial [Cobetia marina]